MGAWSTVVVLLTGTCFTFASKVNYDTNMFASSSWSVPKEIVNLYSPEYYDLTVAESSKPLFNNIFWVPPLQLEQKIGVKNGAGTSKIKSKGHSTSLNSLVKVQDRSFKNGVAASVENDNSSTEYHDSITNITAVEAAVEKKAEMRVEDEYYKQQDSSRNRRENNDAVTIETYQKPEYAVVESGKSVEDHRGESSGYGHQSYIQYDEDPHYQEDELKKKKEIHYHQHKHLHEHDHLQEHNHKHLDEHQDKHYHEHKQYDDHKHYHEAKHEHKEKAEHYHEKYADHKHEHHQEHKHNHNDEHWHQHKQNAWHEHKDKHEHQHKEDAKHYHDKKANHGHHHHHKHEEEGKHHHNHWSEHKHGHDHHHDNKHYHDHKSDHHYQHKRPQKVRVTYKKHPKHGW